MRIGIFDPYLETLGGGEKYMLTAASCLSKKNEVFLFWDKNLNQKASKRFNIDLSNVSFTKNIFSDKVSLAKRLIETSKYDAIFYLSDGSIPIVAAKLYVHFQFPVEWVNTKSIITKQKIKRIRKIVCNSEFTKSFIDKKFNKESIVLYPPTYLKKDSPKVINSNKKNYILNVGRLSKLQSGEYFKKQNFLINAFKKFIDEKKNDWELILVVSYLKENEKLVYELEKLVNGYPIQILKNTTYGKLKEVYQDSKIYWHASGAGEDLENHPELAEHFGITTVEAMANGLVPVVIDAGGQKEIVDDDKNGYIFKDERELVEKTEKLVENNRLWERMSEKAVERARFFSTDEFCEKINSIFQK